MSSIEERYFSLDTYVHLRKTWGRWHLEVFDFPAMQRLEKVSLGWREEPAREAFNRRVAVYMAVTALGLA